MTFRVVALGSGLVLGTFLTLLWIANLGSLGYESLEPSSPGGPTEPMIIAILAVPAVVAVAYLAERVVRRRPTGLWTAAAVGALLGSAATLVA